MTTSTSEPGTRLGGRYRLEDRIAAGAGWAAWKAIDEILARAVTVFTFAPGFPRIAEVVTAARAASRLNDSRLAQVFDVEDARDRAYVVMEWASGDSLTDLLSYGPLEPSRGALLIAEAAGALSSAHAAGVAHMCLSPSSLRWSHTGEVKVVGLGIDAALSGESADDPVLADTEGLGRLLYATLTGLWPGPDYPALPPAPTTGGVVCSPRQVRAGVPASLSDLTCKAMQLRTKGTGDAVRTPDQLARALLAEATPDPIPAAPPPVPPARQRPSPARGGRPSRGGTAPERYAAGPAAFTAPGGYAGAPDITGPGGFGQADGYRETGGYPLGLASFGEGRYAGADERRGPGGRRGGSGHRGGPGRRSGPGRRPRPAVVTVAAAVVALLALGSALAFSRMHGRTHQPPGTPRTHAPSAPAAVHVLAPAGASGFDPLTSASNDPGNENSQSAKYAIDGSATTAWQSQWYRSADFGRLKAGSGLIVDMGKTVRFSSVEVNFGPVGGADVQIRVGNSAARSAANLQSMAPLQTATNVSGTRTFRLSAAGRYLVIWFTKLPPKTGSPPGFYMAQIFSIVVRGSG